MRFFLPCALLLLLPAGCAPASRIPEPTPTSVDSPSLSTYSIVGRDPATGELGIAVQSKFFAVGAVVPWLDLEAGAIATQSWANTSFGPAGLARLRAGATAEQTLAALIESDPGRDRRQVGIVDARGGSASFTGTRCLAWAGGRHGPDYAIQGNILVGEATVIAMESAWKSSKGEPLSERLMRALEAGQEAGGDARGRQSAALRVLKKGAGYGGNDRHFWLNVDDHPRPVAELRRLHELQVGRDAISKAHRAARAGQLEQARRELEAEARRRPGDPRPWLERAVLEARAGDTAALETALERALATQPDFDHLHYRAASLFRDAGLEEKAGEAIRRLLEINPHYRALLEREESQRPGRWKPWLPERP